MSTKKSKVNYLAKIAILSALAYLVHFFEIPLWFAPPFYKIDFSEAIVLIGAFGLGPLAGIIIEAVKIILNVIFTGTQTAFVGEAANLIIGLSYVLPAALIYKSHKTRKNAWIGMAAGIVSIVIIGALLNYFVLLPAYSYFYHMPMDALVGIGSAVNKAVNSAFTLVAFCTVPFNLLKSVLDTLIVGFVYKRVSPLLHR